MLAGIPIPVSSTLILRFDLSISFSTKIEMLPTFVNFREFPKIFSKTYFNLYLSVFKNPS